MSHTSSLLRRVRTRIAAVAAVEDLQRGAAAGGACAAAVLVAGRLGWAYGDLATAVAAAVGTTVLHPVAGFLVRRTDRRAAAAAADERLGLRERMSTALWCGADREAMRREPLGGLVVADAEATASRVASSELAKAFRPRLLRRPLVASGVAVAGCALLLGWQPPARAVETSEEKLARLADQNRVAEVARKLEAAAKVDEQKAVERKQEAVAAAAREVRKTAAEMQKDPPRRETALAKLNEMADRAQAAARRKAGMTAPAETPEATEESRALSQLLQDLSNAGLESLAKDLSELERRLREDPTGDGAPGAEDLRSLAARVDSLRKALERAQQAGAEEMEKALRSIGNEDLLEQIAERLREIASKMDSGNYEGLESEAGESFDLSQMSREELEQLLRDLEEMAGMEDLAKALREGGSEVRGGRRLRLGPGGGT